MQKIKKQLPASPSVDDELEDLCPYLLLKKPSLLVVVVYRDFLATTIEKQTAHNFLFY
jgi:hypothetical protein